MAKLRSNKNKHSPKKVVKLHPKMKDCSVRLTRLSRETIDAYLKSTHITHNISGSISRGHLNIGNCSVNSENGSFSITMKITADSISVSKLNYSLIHSVSPANQKRSLRPKPNIAVKSNAVPKIKKFLTVATFKPDYKKVDCYWQICRKNQIQSQRKIIVNDVVLAKVKGHSPWPAIVLEIIGSKKAKVEFFGAARYECFGIVNIGELTLFEQSLDLVRMILKNKKDPKYQKGIKEVERILDVPSTQSICN